MGGAMCGSSGICGAKENRFSDSNMQNRHPKQNSLSSAKDVGFSYDANKKILQGNPSLEHQDIKATKHGSYSPSTSPSTLSGGDLMTAAGMPAVKSSNNRVANSGSEKPDDPHKQLSMPSMANAHARQSQPMFFENNPSSPHRHSNRPGLAKTRGSQKCLPAANINTDELIPADAGAATTISSAQPRGRERNGSDADFRCQIEQALMEESLDEFHDFHHYPATTSAVTPVATTPPSALAKPSHPHSNDEMVSPVTTVERQKSNSLSPRSRGAYPSDFDHENTSHSMQHTQPAVTAPVLAAVPDRLHRELGARRNAAGSSMQAGPMSAFQARMLSSTPTPTPHKLNITAAANTNLNSVDNVNVDDIYNMTRPSNLSFSAAPGVMSMSMASAANVGFSVPRNDTSSGDFLEYLQSDGTQRHSKTDENSDVIHWGKFSHCSTGSEANSTIAIERSLE